MSFDILGTYIYIYIYGCNCVSLCGVNECKQAEYIFSDNNYFDITSFTIIYDNLVPCYIMSEGMKPIH